MYYNDYNRGPNETEQPIVTDAFRVDGAPRGKRKHGRRVAKTVAICLVCALGGGLVGGAATHLLNGGSLFGNKTTLYEGTHTPVAVTMSSTNTDQPLTLPQIYANNVGACVGITTELVTTNYWGQTVKGAAAGSGFVISTDGYILTNYHVINGATSIKVAFVDGKTYDAKLVGGEESNDIAVLKVDVSDLPAVKLGDSDNLVVGEQVSTIGNPLGELTFSITSGYLSAKDRSITMENGDVMNMLQTDTAINSGNSGGPLFNMFGEVVGITSAKYSSGSNGNASVEGLGFAIPLNDVKDMVTDIMEKGYVTGKPSLGLVTNPVSSDATQRYGIPAGAYVEGVLSGAAAEKAGIQKGDVITAVDDTAVTSSNQLTSAVKNYKAGDTVNFTLYRDGKSQTVACTLDEETAQREQALTDLKTQIEEEQSQQQSQANDQQQQQQSGGNFSWPFGFGW